VADIVSRPYQPDACCEACVFGRGEHAEWCVRQPGVITLARLSDWRKEMRQTARREMAELTAMIRDAKPNA
jgi:hypothetical protein